MKAHRNCAGYALKALSHPDLQAVNSALEMWFKARVSPETSEVLSSQGWVFAHRLALLCISLPQNDFARLTSLLETLFLFALANDRLKPIYLNLIMNKQIKIRREIALQTNQSILFGPTQKFLCVWEKGSLSVSHQPKVLFFFCQFYSQLKTKLFPQ